jgi:hypothetical protein
VAEVTRTLNNSGKLDKREEKIFLNLELANYGPMKMMES